MENPRLPDWAKEKVRDSTAVRMPRPLQPRPAASKRRQEQTRKNEVRVSPPPISNTASNEPLLLKLAREERWEEVIAQCLACPAEAQPVATCISPASPKFPQKARKCQDHRFSFTSEASLPVYRETALGILCSSNLSSNQEMVLKVADALLTSCPGQVCCSQLKAGHSPLRDALHNPSLFPKFLGLLLKTDVALSIQYSLIQQPDQDGMLPLDHIIKSIHLESSPFALELLETYTQVVVGGIPQDEKPTTTSSSSSPLIRLLSLGNSFGLLPSAPTRQSTYTGRLDSSRLERILRATLILLRWNPKLVYQYSHATGCLPLHVALRNYGNVTGLIRLLIRDCDAIVWKHRNRYGDLPLHVACAVGVPLDILLLVLAQTLRASKSVECGPDALVWSRNLAGYTPIDLEWVRHIEAGNGFLSHRVYYPLDVRGLRKPVGREGEVYEKLLRQAVNQVVEHSSSSSEAFDPKMVERQKCPGMEVNGAFGLLLHRIFIIIRTAFRDSWTRSPYDLTGDTLHLASALCGPSGPRLPRPILDMIQKQYPEDISRRDHFGRTPLHYCFLSASRSASPPLSRTDQEVEAKVAREWRKWVEHILETEPVLAQVPDDLGRLPLHYSLVYPWKSGTKVYTLSEPVRDAVAIVIDKFLQSYPESIDMQDPTSRMHPFLLAAMNPDIALDTSFLLLKRSPGVVALYVTEQTTAANGNRFT